MDFGALPPEINSTRMYAGAGAAPLMAAGATWNGLAVELSTTASSVESVIMQLTTNSGWVRRRCRWSLLPSLIWPG